MVFTTTSMSCLSYVAKWYSLTGMGILMQCDLKTDTSLNTSFTVFIKCHNVGRSWDIKARKVLRPKFCFKHRRRRFPEGRKWTKWKPEKLLWNSFCLKRINVKDLAVEITSVKSLQIIVVGDFLLNISLVIGVTKKVTKKSPFFTDHTWAKVFTTISTNPSQSLIGLRIYKLINIVWF